MSLLQSEPLVTIGFSENDKLYSGEVMPLSVAEFRLIALDEELKKQDRGYDKTDFALNCFFKRETYRYEGRYDLGDCDGGLIKHVEIYTEGYRNNEVWIREDSEIDPQELEKIKKRHGFILNEIIPCLELHSHLS